MFNIECILFINWQCESLGWVKLPNEIRDTFQRQGSWRLSLADSNASVDGYRFDVSRSIRGSRTDSLSNVVISMYYTGRTGSLSSALCSRLTTLTDDDPAVRMSGYTGAANAGVTLLHWYLFIFCTEKTWNWSLSLRVHIAWRGAYWRKFQLRLVNSSGKEFSYTFAACALNE